MVTREQIVWAAGLIEGEGYFIVPRIKHQAISIGIKMTDRDVIARVAGFWGTKVISEKRAQSHHKPIWMTRINGPDAAAWMFMLFPFMGLRRQAKIAECLAVWRARGTPRRYRTQCQRGHTAFRTETSGGRNRRVCVTCHRQAARDYYKREQARGRLRLIRPDARQRGLFGTS